ncbi:MAG TPA: protein kinase [Ktedonobacteraceae bacterium]|nr:protein kinase [Ktedonobacteraceae bacterium]
MTQRNARLVAGVYQVGQIIAAAPPLISYSAYNRNTNGVVGLLVIDLLPSVDPIAARQALAPLERRRQVQSQHVISVFNWGVAENKVYIVTDPPRGITLRQLMDSENIGLARALDLATQITRGAVALQARGIAEIDLRPALITVDTIGLDDRAQIDDVGLRFLYRQLGYMAGQSSQDIGYLDPRYMTPEQFFQGSSGPASDVYLLGLLLFELVTGRPPFVGRTPAETGMLQSSGPVPQMKQFKHTTPPALQTIVERALAKDPAQRYPHAMALLSALESLPRLIADEDRSLPQIDLPRPAKSDDLTTEMVSAQHDRPIESIDTVIINKQALRVLDENNPLVPENATVYAYLDLEREGEPVQRIPLREKYVIIGRIDPKRGIKPEIDLTPFDPDITVSRQHARIRFERTFFYIEDLKSRNKTRLGALVLSPLQPELLQHGDVIWIGSLKLTFRIPGLSTPPVPKNLP